VLNVSDLNQPADAKSSACTANRNSRCAFASTGFTTVRLAAPLATTSRRTRTGRRSPPLFPRRISPRRIPYLWPIQDRPEESHRSKDDRNGSKNKPEPVSIRKAVRSARVVKAQGKDHHSDNATSNPLQPGQTRSSKHVASDHYRFLIFPINLPHRI
jgi:hypothetical protein